MAHTTTQAQPGFSVLRAISAIGSSVFSALIRMSESQSHVRRVAFLQSLSDEELQKRGIKRSQIVQHVFADRIWI